MNKEVIRAKAEETANKLILLDDAYVINADTIEAALIQAVDEAIEAAATVLRGANKHAHGEAIRRLRKGKGV